MNVHLKSQNKQIAIFFDIKCHHWHFLNFHFWALWLRFENFDRISNLIQLISHSQLDEQSASASFTNVQQNQQKFFHKITKAHLNRKRFWYGRDSLRPIYDTASQNCKIWAFLINKLLRCHFRFAVNIHRSNFILFFIERLDSFINWQPEQKKKIALINIKQWWRQHQKYLEDEWIT